MPPTVRPPSEADAPAILEVIAARDVADLGVPDFTLEHLRADWATPGLALEHDARVADGGGPISGYALLLGDDAVVVVHPDAEGEGIGTVLRRRAEARASERRTGYVAELAVAPRALGLGGALLLGLFAASRATGSSHAELSVHGRDRGAPALDESVGMRTTWRAERWEKALGRA